MLETTEMESGSCQVCGEDAGSACENEEEGMDGAASVFWLKT